MLPILVLREIFSFLSVKERAKCRAVCRDWKQQVDWYDEGRDSLLFHTGLYSLNKHWSWTNRKGLVRIENSFEIRNFEFLKNAPTISKLKSLKRLKKIMLVDGQSFYRASDLLVFRELQNYLKAFEECEELEIEDFLLAGHTLIRLFKLKVLVLKMLKLYCKLEIDCPALEVLIVGVMDANNHEVTYKNLSNLKHLEVTSSVLNFASFERFPKLKSISFFNDASSFSSDLLSYTPALKRLIFYTSNPQSDYRELIRQKELYNLDNDLQVFINGFDLNESEMFAISPDRTTIDIDEQCIDGVFNFYPRMMDSKINWVVMLDYDLLHSKFKIVPADWFSRFGGVDILWLKRAPSGHHLTGFLKQCPALDKLVLSLAKFSDARLLDLCFSLTPSIRELAIYENDYSAVANFDYSFLYNLKVAFVRLHSVGLPANFLRTIFRTCKHLGFFQYFHDRQSLIVALKSDGFDLTFISQTGNRPGLHFATLNDLIDYLKNDPQMMYICREDSETFQSVLDKQMKKASDQILRQLGIY